VASLLQQAGLRVDSNLSSEKIGSKIRSATIEKVPFMLIVGEKEQAENKVAVRHRTEGDKGAVAIDQFVAQVKEEIATRK